MMYSRRVILSGGPFDGDSVAVRGEEPLYIYRPDRIFYTTDPSVKIEDTVEITQGVYLQNENVPELYDWGGWDKND